MLSDIIPCRYIHTDLSTYIHTWQMQMQVSRYASKILHVCCEIFATFFYGSVTLVRSMLQTFSCAVEVGISLTPSWFLHPCLTYGPWV